MNRFKHLLFYLFVGVTFPFLSAQSQSSDSSLIIDQILIEGNRVTKENIILKELVFSSGDEILKIELISALERSKENLLNLSIFNFVNFEVNHHGLNQIDIIVKVEERWYIWPTPIFEHGERNLSTFLKEPEWSKLNYGMFLKWNNFRGRNELLNAKIRLGYKEQFVLQYDKPNLGASENHKISLSYSLSRQHRVKYLTQDNLPVYFKDEDNYAFNTADANVAYTYRPGLYTKHRIRLHYVDDWISDTVSQINPNYFGNGYTRYKYFKIDYVLRYDIRDSKIYPLEGHAFKFKVQRFGLGVLPSYPYGNWEAEAAVFYHRKITGRFYFADVVKGKISTNKSVPLMMQKAIGYAENFTAYDDFVIDGTDYFINKFMLKYQLVKPTVFSVPFLQMKQFNKIHFAMYLNLLGDVGCVYSKFLLEPSNNMVNELQYSTGIGIDFVTYYDKVFSIEYAVNRYGMSGFFFRVETPFIDW